MTFEPYASATRVFWIVDNGSSHRGKASIERLEGQWPTLRLIHLPVHASWLNQVEIYFSIVQRKVLTPNDFTDLDAIAATLLAFEALRTDRQAARMEIHPQEAQCRPQTLRQTRYPSRTGRRMTPKPQRTCEQDH